MVLTSCEMIDVDAVSGLPMSKLVGPKAGRQRT